ncbi:MAG: hypothetical protein OEV34_15515 [Gammaproteobacteria bacterium]|nr:hypothetical protein [Gammaproteobacteria bacterium]
MITKRVEGMTARKNRPWVTYALMFIPAALVTWLSHEFAHWQMGEALGYDMWISLNGGGLAGEGSYDSPLDRSLVDAAGPLLTYILAIGALALIRMTRSLLLYPLLFLQFYMRAVALGISVVSQPNDEARISLELGLPLWLLPGIAVTLLLVLTVIGSRTVRAGWTGNIIAYVMASLLSTAIVFLDPGPFL